MNEKTSFSRTRSTEEIMRLVCLGLVPGGVAQFYFFGWGVIINLVLCCSFAIAAESFVLILRKRKVLETIKDNSALLTGLLIGLSIPPLLPWWMSLIGVSFAIIFAKQLYGGLGANLFNPAMVGYLILLISFPLSMSNWLPNQYLTNTTPSLMQSIDITLFGATNDLTGKVQTLMDYRLLADGFTMATPLDHIRTNLTQGHMISEILSGENYSINSNSWLWINLAYLSGGLYLLFLRIIRWHIPISILFSMGITASFLSMIDNQLYLSATDHLILGATMISAFYIATDPVSASTTPRGRIIYGTLIGFTVVMIRTFGSYPDAFAFAIILLNIAVPTIDFYFKPKVYGEKIPVKILETHDE